MVIYNKYYSECLGLRFDIVTEKVYPALRTRPSYTNVSSATMVGIRVYKACTLATVDSYPLTR